MSLKKIVKAAAPFVAFGPTIAGSALAIKELTKQDKVSEESALAAGEQAARGVQRQSQLAQDFREQLPHHKNSAMGLATDDSRRDLAKNIADVRSNASRRGLLYSGLRAGAENNAVSQYGSDLARKRAEINSAYDQQADQMDDAAILAGFNNLAITRGAADSEYQAALAQRQGRDAALSGMFSGIGQMGGTMAAKNRGTA